MTQTVSLALAGKFIIHIREESKSWCIVYSLTLHLFEYLTVVNIMIITKKLISNCWIRLRRMWRIMQIEEDVSTTHRRLSNVWPIYRHGFRVWHPSTNTFSLKKMQLFHLRITINAIFFVHNCPSSIVSNQIYHQIDGILQAQSKYGKRQLVIKNLPRNWSQSETEMFWMNVKDYFITLSGFVGFAG